MLLRVFSVYDCKAESYAAPMYVKAKGEMIRMFVEIANDKEHQIGKYPEDFTLFELGTFDDSCARFDLLPAPVAIGKGIEFLKS